MYTNTDPQIDQEFWSLFVSDSQKALESYATTLQHLSSPTWKEDMQTLYRAVHTIKGGAATIGAESILVIAKAIEQIFSELRYLDTAPSLDDNNLLVMFRELEHLLQGSMAQSVVVEHALDRIAVLHQEVKERCLAGWDETRQLHQDFADQGFDLMVLNLEMGIEVLTDKIPESLVETAMETMEQLLDVGQDIGLGSQWQYLIQRGMELAMSTDPLVWQTDFLQHLHQMKASARRGGKELPGIPSPTPREIPLVIEESMPDTPPTEDLFDQWLAEESSSESTTSDRLFAEETPLEAQASEPLIFEIPSSDTRPNLDHLFEEELILESSPPAATTDNSALDRLFWEEEEPASTPPPSANADHLFAEEFLLEEPLPIQEEILRKEDLPIASREAVPLFDEELPSESQSTDLQTEFFPEPTSQAPLEVPERAEPAVDPELRALFDMDTQKYLQVYFSTVEKLDTLTWRSDIQHIYRAIHTIKGGAATVGASPILQVAKVLEDWLSDLRSLEDPPPIDENFRDSLLECGELLIGTLQMSNRQQPTASIERIVSLHSTFKLSYGEELSEQALLQREFAEQGFDLVSLDLEMCLEQLTSGSTIETEMIAANQQVLEQLVEIGQELQLKGDWDSLLAEGIDTIKEANSSHWLEKIPPILRSLKEAAKHGGSIAKPARPQPAPAPAPIVTSEPIDPELKALFDVDTQKYLQEYFTIVESLAATSWKQDIQKLYRAIHTIKGGAATVGASAILQVAKVLEDWLSDLRNLEEAPPIEGDLRSGLLESGELLIGTLQMEDRAIPTASVERILSLHEAFKQVFASQLDEQTLLHREFADQGFDLMVLELEMALEQLTPESTITPALQETATQTLGQLAEIGAEIGLAEGWSKLILEGNTLITSTQVSLWQEQWMPYLKSLKECARRSGKPPEAPKPKPELEKPIVAEVEVAQPDIQIPVPLERLDRSAQFLVETLMATRATQGFYQIVQRNLVPLVSLAQDSAQYISRLREVQDDFAVVDTDSRSETGVKLERYRQGYTAINRLLEITLRLMELGAETGEAARRTTDSLSRLEQSLLNLQGTVEESRLVPFESLAFRARGILRDLTTRMNKPARLYVTGEKLELDAGTLRNLEPVLLHLIRNSFDHGLEPPEDRERQGKPRQGRIDLSLIRRGSVFVLELKDDGRGIDPQKIHNAAVAKGLPLTDTSTPEKLLTVICQPGFTSAKAVSDISGRGVGMDVVGSQVAAMGGQLNLRTKVGSGTTFTIQIPVPNLFVRCMLLQVADRIFALPTTEVFTTMLMDDLLWRRIPPAEAKFYPLEIEEDRGYVPALDIFQYWQGDRNQRTILPTAIAVRTKRVENSEGIWIVADTMIGQSDLLVNSLPQPLIPPIGILGVSLMPDGKLIPVIDSLALMDALIGKTQDALTPTITAHSAAEEETGEEGLQILVVDDAALMRRRIESGLTPQGYKVHTCSDGLEAWDWLQTHRQPSLLITDIEMPGMDGFTLIDHCRQAAMTMPILVVSSRLAEEWSRETQRLGATDFLTKGFGTAELLAKVATLIEQSTPQPVKV